MLDDELDMTGSQKTSASILPAPLEAAFTPQALQIKKD
jgi:hypothetical protein